ncbi:MAG: hypothetical protein LUH22_12305 [Bacteroides sp.]|nr:hypothetical protein [Bacteroides sp.]
MKTAILLSNGCLEYLTGIGKLQIVIFTLDHDEVSEIENEFLLHNDINYFTLWCLSKGVNEVYAKTVPSDHRKIFQKLDISIKTADELQSDYLYNTFILRDEHIHP